MAQRLATCRIGRVLLHLTALVRDHQLRWHLAGVLRELGMNGNMMARAN